MPRHEQFVTHLEAQASLPDVRDAGGVDRAIVRPSRSALIARTCSASSAAEERLGGRGRLLRARCRAGKVTDFLGGYKFLPTSA